MGKESERMVTVDFLAVIEINIVCYFSMIVTPG
jgi:hypothetical protein